MKRIDINNLRQYLHRFCFLLFLIVLSPSVLSQGTVKGVVTDKADQTPLVSATIVVKGTTIGTITKNNGEYTLPLKAGDYTLQFLYLGYETVEESISVADNQVIVVNKALTAQAIMGEEVVVTMQARGQLSAVNQQLRSNQIINVVSEDRIRELPDENAAQAISRLPGVHLDGSRVVIRGLEPKHNQIMINGMNLPSISTSSATSGAGSSRSTDLNIISANMLSGIEVFKTLTPDMDADAIGGVVNLRFREAYPGLHYSITTQGTYNQQEKVFGGMKLWGDVSNRFLNNRLGVILNVNYETRNGGDDWITASYNLQDAAEPGEGIYMMNALNVYDQLQTNQTFGGSLVMDYNLPKGQLLFTSLLSHSTPEETLYQDAMEPGRNYRYGFLRRGKYAALLTNNSLHLEQQLGFVNLDASVSHAFVKRETDFRYEMRVKDATVRPFVDSLITEAIKLRMEPIDVYDALDPAADKTARYYETTVIPNNYDESQWMADLNLEAPLRLSDNIDVNFKVGGKYLRMSRNYDEQLLQDYYPNAIFNINMEISDWLATQGITTDGSSLFFSDIRDYDYKPNKGFMNGQDYYLGWVVSKDFMDEMILRQVNLDRETTNFLTDARDGRYDYWGWESKAAGYAMAEINLGKRITIIPGVRYERTHNEYTAPKIKQGTQWTWQIQDTLTRPADHHNILPHLHLRVKATDWWDIRFSYNHTLSRPDYQYAVPSIYYHEISFATSAGNPYIEPAVSENFDGNFTFYSRKMGLITLGGYYKRIDGFFYSQPTLLKNIVDFLPDSSILYEFPIETYTALLNSPTNFYINSPYTAYVKGLELEWQSNFTWLPAPFSGLVLNANYTHVWSETKYMQHRIRYERPPGSFVPVPVEVDTFYVNRLLHQADDIANVSVGYDLKGFSARVSFRFQGNVIRSVGTRPEENQYTSNIYAYDFVVKQNIPFKYGQLEVFLNAINFTNVPQERYRTFKTPEGNDRDAITYQRYSGRQFQLGVRFKY